MSGGTTESRVDPKRLPQAVGRFSAVPRPFLKWAGSKQALIQQIVPHLPTTYSRYYEPFLGSGALFFALKPERATLSDASRELIETWLAVRDHSQHIMDVLSPLRPDKDLFYKIRSDRSIGQADRAAEFIYLNRTCWNGLYRVNSKGEFNVPYGSPKSDFIFDPKNILACAEALKSRHISVRNTDFSDALRSVRAGDLVFLDPPYVTKHNYNGFRDWNEKLFRWADQERLAEWAFRLADRGAHVFVSNADHSDIVDLYRGFNHVSLTRSSTLAGNMSKRGMVTEALFHNS